MAADSNETGRAARVKELAAEFALKRSHGEQVDEKMFLTRHRDLMPELGRELKALQEIHRIRLAAERAGRVEEAVQILSSDELEAPIVVDEDPNEQTVVTTFKRLPKINGYVIRRELLAGGQGAVFEATQETTGRRVAIKVMPSGPFANSKNRTRFAQEADILAKLDHRNIVGIIDRGQTDNDLPYFVMEFVEGKPLDDYARGLAKDGADGLKKVISLFIKVADAVDEAHGQGIIHRDLKPSNVFVDKQGEPRVLDFGLARLEIESPETKDPANALTRSGQLVGSLPWASPEQASGDLSEMDTRTDIYSLGVILYQVLAGRFPYEVTGPIYETLAHIQHTVPIPPGKSRSKQHQSFAGVDGFLDRVVMKSLEKNRDKRFASMQQFAAEMRRWVEGRYSRWMLPYVGKGTKQLIAAILLVGIGTGGWFKIGKPLLARYRTVPALQTPPPAPFSRIRNSIGMDLVYIPPGKFAMGSAAAEPDRNDDEFQHTVQLSRGFYMATTEVTRRQYHAVMGIEAFDLGYEDLPIASVSWADAVKFCDELTKRDGRKYRLPTEAEWEFACRAGSTTPIPAAKLSAAAWYDANSSGHPWPVAAKTANAWQIFDMLGSVREWCADFYKAYPREEVSDPKGPATSTQRVARGGDFASSPTACRPAARFAQDPEKKRKDTGFRVITE